MDLNARCYDVELAETVDWDVTDFFKGYVISIK